VSNAYPLVFAVGSLGGLLSLLAPWRSLRRRGAEAGAVDTPAVVDAGWIALLAGLLGARLAYVAAHASYFVAHPAEAPAFWLGGLSWAGGALGAWLGLVGAARVLRQDGWALADRLILPAAGQAGAAWLGCLLDGWAYGVPTGAGWGAIPASGVLETPVPRWPTQWVGVCASLATLVLLIWLAPRLRRTGLLASLGMSLISAICLGLSFVRADPVPMVHGLRLEMLGSAAILAASLAGLIARVAPGLPVRRA
jgi:phosphatidylglycerol:prolipoprotein diacylglycerol transferase